MAASTGNEFKDLRGAGEELEYDEKTLKEYVRCSQDIIYFAETYVYVVTQDHGLRLVKLAPHQKRLLKAFIDTPDGKRHNVVLSARQSYKTTTTFIYVLWYALFNANKEIAIMANKEKSAKGIIKRIKTAYKKLPKWLQKGIVPGGWNTKSVGLDNGSTISASTTSPSSARSESLSLLILDEFGFVPENIASEFMASVYPTIVAGLTTKIIVLSTMNGNNHYSELYAKAVRGENNFYPCRVYWNEVPIDPVTSMTVLRDDKWKEAVIKDIGTMRWLKEFECQIIGSTATLIDSSYLVKLSYIEPIEIRYDGLMMIYEPLDPNAIYLVAADPGEGLGKDFSVVQVIRITSLEDFKQVAIYRDNKVSPHDFAGLIDDISKLYNNAYIMVENNGKSGGKVIECLFEQLNCDRLINPVKKDKGIPSTSKSKFNANINLKNCVEKGWLKITDKQTIFELGRYVEVNQISHAFANESPKDHDDCVTSLMWTVYFLEILEFIPLTFDKVTKTVVVLNAKPQDQTENTQGMTIIFDDSMENSEVFVDEDGTIWQ